MGSPRQSAPAFSLRRRIPWPVVSVSMTKSESLRYLLSGSEGPHRRFQLRSFASRGLNPWTSLSPVSPPRGEEAIARAQGPRLHYRSAPPAPGAGAAYERHRRLIATSLLLHFRPLRKLARGEKGMERCLAHRPRRVQHGEGYPDIGILDHSKTREGRRRLRPAGARDPVPGARRWIFPTARQLPPLVNLPPLGVQLVTMAAAAVSDACATRVEC